jgi:TatA/E family protein of Tat protein translocase
MFGLSISEILIVLMIVILLFGSKKIPALAKGLGESVHEFKKAIKSKDDHS